MLRAFFMVNTIAFTMISADVRQRAKRVRTDSRRMKPIQ